MSEKQDILRCNQVTDPNICQRIFPHNNVPDTVHGSFSGKDYDHIENHLHIWMIEPDIRPGIPNRFRTHLSSTEICKADRYHFSRDRDHYLYYHGVIREILGLYAGILPGDLEFHYDENGKPSLHKEDADPIFHFNFSHSQEKAVLAIHPAHEVGIDIERRIRFPEQIEVARNTFSDDERKLLGSIPTETRLETFYTIWTCREALGKACKMGLYPASENLIDTAEQQWFVNPDGWKRVHACGRIWSMMILPDIEDYALALVVESTPKIWTHYYSWRQYNSRSIASSRSFPFS